MIAVSAIVLTIVIMDFNLFIKIVSAILLIISFYYALYIKPWRLNVPVKLTLQTNRLWRCYFMDRSKTLVRLISHEKHWYGFYIKFTSVKGDSYLAIPYFQIHAEQRSAFARAIKDSGDHSSQAIKQ